MKKSKVAKALSLLLVLPAGLGLVTFTVVNRSPVIIDFWPLPTNMQAPLSAVILLSLITGVIWGGVASWLAAGTARNHARQIAKRAEQAEAQSKDLKDRVARLESEVGEPKAPSITAETLTSSSALPPANTV